MKTRLIVTAAAFAAPIVLVVIGDLFGFRQALILCASVCVAGMAWTYPGWRRDE